VYSYVSIFVWIPMNDRSGFLLDGGNFDSKNLLLLTCLLRNASCVGCTALLHCCQPCLHTIVIQCDWFPRVVITQHAAYYHYVEMVWFHYPSDDQCHSVWRLLALKCSLKWWLREINFLFYSPPVMGHPDQYSTRWQCSCNAAISVPGFEMPPQPAAAISVPGFEMPPQIALIMQSERPWQQP